MFRTVIAAVALFGMAAGEAQAQGYVGAYENDGVTIFGKPHEAYVIRLPTRGKDIATLRREISDAAYVACRRAPRTGNMLEMRLSAMSICVNQARLDADRQLDRLAHEHRLAGGIDVAANPY